MIMRLAILLFMVSACSTRGGGGSFSDLRLSALPDKLRVRASERVRVKYVVENVGTRPVAGCYTFKGGYDLWGTKDIRQSISVVDHPVCVELFTLAAGGTASWSIEIEVPDVGEGPAAFTAWIRVADAATCGEYGCDEQSLRASAAQIIVE
jgi:hypothetical protein